MANIDVIEEAERRTRLKFYRDLVGRLTTAPSIADDSAHETFEHHVGDVAWATHLLARACGQEAVLDVLQQLTAQLSEPAYWKALAKQRAAIRQNAEDLKDKFPELWEHYREAVSE